MASTTGVVRVWQVTQTKVLTVNGDVGGAVRKVNWRALLEGEDR